MKTTSADQGSCQDYTCMISICCETTGSSTDFWTFGRELRPIYNVNRDIRTVVCLDNYVPEITNYYEKLVITLPKMLPKNDRQNFHVLKIFMNISHFDSIIKF